MPGGRLGLQTERPSHIPERSTGSYQIFLRYLNSPTSVELTHEKRSVFVEGWAHDKTHLIVSGAKQEKDGTTCELYSVPTVGGDPEFIMGYPSCYYASLAPDGSALVDSNERQGRLPATRDFRPSRVATESLRAGPLGQEGTLTRNAVVFSPDGKTILYYRNTDTGSGEVWLLPYPATRRESQARPEGFSLQHPCRLLVDARWPASVIFRLPGPSRASLPLDGGYTFKRKASAHRRHRF